MNKVAELNSDVNRMVRILEGTRMKYTVRVNLPDGRAIEWQADNRPEVKWHPELREPWLYQGGYPASEIMKWVPDSILIIEENPDQKK